MPIAKWAPDLAGNLECLAETGLFRPKMAVSAKNFVMAVLPLDENIADMFRP